MSESIRYHAASRYTYAVAISRLLDLARWQDGPGFQFGPVRLADLEQNGLEVTGTDLSGVSDVLRQVPGLARIESQGV